MRDDEIQELLRRADADVERAVAAPRELCRQVRALDRRRRRRARALAASAPLVLLAAGVATWSWRGARDDAPLPHGDNRRDGGTAEVAVDNAQAAEELARLAAEADFHLLIARRMIAAFEQQNSMDRARRELALGDGLDDVRRELDVVAYRMICRADRLREAMEPSEEAVALYRQVVELFPATYSAEVARQRLAQTMN